MTDKYRLPRTVVPSRYELRLAPDLATRSFAGTATITVAVHAATAEVVLNAVELEIGAVSAWNDAGQRIAGSARPEADLERARLVFPEALAPGAWRLELEFSGGLNDKLRGFYRSRYTEAGGGERWLAATQFEAVDARRAFPCWDEPSFKAVFAVTLVVDEDLEAISNARVVETRREGGAGKKAVRFADTIPMSTYLVAVIVGRLEATDAVAVGSTPVRVWCVPGKRAIAGFGAQIAAFSLRFFEDYYGMPYPGDKLDLIAIPDFASGAMENLGAITFRETALLVDEKTATHAELERVADVVAHEVAHMWFGDLVTMSWWNGIWLNEAFATFMEMLCVDAWKPEWRRWVTFGVSRAAALALDGLHSSRSIEVAVRAPKDAEAMFDALTYEKGASVLRMLEQHLGPRAFRAGIRTYLDRHKFGNTETRDLWEALGAADIMDEWIFTPGYPAISVEPTDGGLELRQQRFTYLPREGPDHQRWSVPIALRFSAHGTVETRTVLLRQATERVALPGPLDWVVVNAGGHGYYRVRYAPALLAQLAGRAHAVAEPIERFNLVSDAWAFTVAGQIAVSEFLALTVRFREETDRNVWTALVGALAQLNRLIRREERPALQALVRDRLGPSVDRLGLEPRPGESELERQLRGDLIGALGTLGNDAAIQRRARELYAGDHALVDPPVLSAVIAITGFTAGPAEYDDLLSRFKAARTPQDEQRYLYALAGVRDPALLAQTLDRTLDGEFRTQDAPFVVRALLMSVYAREPAWRFARQHWETMAARYPASAYRRMWEGIVGLATPELEREVLEFFRTTGIDLGGQKLAQYLEQLRVAVAFHERGAVLGPLEAGRPA
jgi:puromycin-sensitive aminopeptidase